MTFTQILPYLIQRRLVEIKPFPPALTSPPRNYDANARYNYHACSLGHTIEKWLALKFKVQYLLDRKIISFTEESLNMKNSSTSVHNGLIINAIEGSGDQILIREVDQVKTPMTRIRKKLIGYKLF